VLSSAVRTFTDPANYAEAIRQGRVEVTVTGRGHFTAQLIRIDLHHLWMQRFSEGMARIKHTKWSGWTRRHRIPDAVWPEPVLEQHRIAAGEHHTT
jgi:hypothetical protein